MATTLAHDVTLPTCHDWADLGVDRLALMEVLGGVSLDVIDRLYTHGLRVETLPLLEWLPAVEVCWLDGADAAERHALRVLYIADGRATEAGLALLDGWLTTRPPMELIAAARMALASRLVGLDDEVRDELLDRVIGISQAAGRAAGGGFGEGPLSTDERRHVERLRRYLRTAH